MGIMKYLIFAFLLISCSISAQVDPVENFGVVRVGNDYLLTDTNYISSSRFRVEYNVYDSVTLLNNVFNKIQASLNAYAQKSIDRFEDLANGKQTKNQLTNWVGSDYYLIKMREVLLNDIVGFQDSSGVTIFEWTYTGYQDQTVKFNINYWGKDPTNTNFCKVIPISENWIRVQFEDINYPPVDLFRIRHNIWGNDVAGQVHILRK